MTRSEDAKYALVNIFGRQYKVSQGDTIRASYVNLEVGATIPFSEVLMIKSSDSDIKVGAPLVQNAKVVTQVVSHGRAEKVLVFKYLRKNKSKKMRGHRQPFTTLSITSIEG